MRTHGDPQALLPMVRRVVTSIDPDLPVFDVRPLEGIAADAVATERFALLLFGLFAALALGLSVVGIYGVLAYTVAQRLPEFGVRVALGARPAQLLEMVLAQGARMAATRDRARRGRLDAGERAGFGGCCSACSHSTRRRLPPWRCLFALVALAACFMPARRAARVDPLTAIRN